jgi:hypothetical protein
MALARFFERVFRAAGRALSVSREALETTLGNQVVAVECGTACTEEGNSRWIAELLVNLLARLYPRLAIAAEAQAVREHLIGIARAINPAVDIEEVPAATVTVVVGGAESPHPNTIHARADGWVARVMFQPLRSPMGPANPYAAAAAATLAAAEVFRRIFRERLPAQQEPRELHLSLLDFSAEAGADAPLEPVDVGQVVIAGLGAVGNGALWAMGRHTALTGEVWLVDHEAVELSNLQRYVLATDVDERAAKAELAQAALRQTRLRRHACRETLESFAERFQQGFTLPTVCVSVDNVPGRRAVQALLPRLVLNGWTSDSGLGASWHEFDREAACLACLYHPTGPRPSQTDVVARALGLDPERAARLWIDNAAPTPEELAQMEKHLGLKAGELKEWRGKRLGDIYTGVICGSVRLDVQGVGRVEVVPLTHQSVLAGVLMAAELVKRLTPSLCARSQHQVLTAWEDVLRRPPPAGRWVHDRPRVPGCICSDKVYQEVYRRKWRPEATLGGTEPR